MSSSFVGRYLALDVGERRIGIAVSDPLGITAQGVETYNRKDGEDVVAYILSLVDQYQAIGLVVGLPKNMNNTIGFKAQEVQAFVETILVQRPELPIHWIDERLTTVQATQVLLEADVSRKKRKKSVDKLASVIILQNFLDQR